MKAARFCAFGTILAACLLAISPGTVEAQLVWKPPKPLPTEDATDGVQRPVQRLDARPAVDVAATGPSRAVQRRPANSGVNAYPVRHAGLEEADAGSSAVELSPASPEVIPAPEGITPESVPGQPKMFAPQFEGPAGAPWGPEPYGGFDSPCDACGQGGPCHDACDPWCDVPHGCLVDWLSGFTFFAGIHGFKGPVDLGQNGNFGFHEGLNFGGPLGDPWGLGYQIGAQAVHSDLTGFQADPAGGGALDPNGRDQFFFTAGIFKRAIGRGLQGGVVFDYVHDNYYDKADLRQIRSESAIMFGGGVHELGYWGAYGVNRQRFVIPTTPNDLVFLQPNDIFAGFYRRHFSGGGQGRLWAGATGAGQGIIGGEATVPLGTSWALENNFVYVIPKTAAAEGGQAEESWSVSISLVWFPGRPARSVFRNPFHPLFGVSDNSAFLVRR